ncbi:hypothetical protein [Enterococcus faecium]|uniref:hypothetical protein n=2 Tax=Enterococcus TaxID=1350 RepID=UPI001E5F45DF|nr:hypothetical protein [Enterococcus faecium]MDB7366739.1 hypothetical protein [Enterococcus faecium]MDB7520547.1 hypothetical protein [Enterococcus faecium]MDB7523926.1 hypothetical protein [Enterococcus faecium]MDB7525638.1 hypothetical protein [Enterococcus faecium]MDB7529183.1 hypothetical protein [Enterococcus faecium]
MKKDSFQVISDRFLETAYGKSKEEILHLYQNDAQFKEDYDAVKQHLIDVLEPIVKEVYETARKVIEPVVQSITELVQSNPEYFKALQKQYESKRVPKRFYVEESTHMENEEAIVRAIASLNKILQNEKVLRVSVETDSEWEDGIQSIDISVKYLPSGDVSEAK